MTGYAREHRDSLLVILSRVQRGVQSSAEASLLRTHVEHLLTEIDEAEAAIARVRALPPEPQIVVQVHIPGWTDQAAYNRGWSSAASAVRAALDEPKEPTP